MRYFLTVIVTIFALFVIADPAFAYVMVPLDSQSTKVSSMPTTLPDFNKWEMIESGDFIKRVEFYDCERDWKGVAALRIGYYVLYADLERKDGLVDYVYAVSFLGEPDPKFFIWQILEKGDNRDNIKEKWFVVKKAKGKQIFGITANISPVFEGGRLTKVRVTLEDIRGQEHSFIFEMP